LEAIVRGYITGEQHPNNRIDPFWILTQSVSFYRFGVGRIQKDSYGTWDLASRGPPGITKASHPALHALHKSRTRSARREHLSRTR